MCSGVEDDNDHAAYGSMEIEDGKVQTKTFFPNRHLGRRNVFYREKHQKYVFSILGLIVGHLELEGPSNQDIANLLNGRRVDEVRRGLHGI